MKSYAAVIILVLITRYSFALIERNVKDSEDELVAVAVLYRDGDKTPSSSFPNDPYFNLSYWPMGFGQLTEQGKEHQYELGQWFRQRYDGFLPEEFNTKDIYVLSTDTDRTLMSAQANLAGLYPPTGTQVWNKNLLWQPIPVHTVPKNEDQVLYMERPCAKYNDLYEKTSNSAFFQNINEEYTDFYTEVSNLTGWEIDDVDYFYQLQSVLNVYSVLEPTYLPSWYSTLDLEKLNYLAGLDYARYTFTDDLKRLGDGPFFDNLVTGLDKILDETQEAPKFLMYSAHESTLGSVLNGMGLFDNQAPQFASCVVWEVRKADDDHYVNLFYKRNSSDVLDQLQLPGCDSDCSYENFKSILSPITMDLDTWDAECADSD